MTNRQRDGRTHDGSIYRDSIASRAGKVASSDCGVTDREDIGTIGVSTEA